MSADLEAPELGRTTDEKIEIWRYWANEEWLWAWACEHGTHMYGYGSYDILLEDLKIHMDRHFSCSLHCENCGKIMAEHDALAHCWGPESKTYKGAEEG